MVCLFRTVFRMLWFAFVQYLGCSGLPFSYNAGCCGCLFVKCLGCCGLPCCTILRIFWFAILYSIFDVVVCLYV